ncbi:MAG: bifunctional pyr operon transcriptional regulator/uracil phosphoribosyltransferase PyrR [Candidatus Margulisiibacteriota bacterium]
MAKKSKINGSNVKIIMNEAEIDRALRRIAQQIIEINKGAKDIVLVGIMQRGVPLAKRLAEIIKKEEGESIPVGELDVSLYRDDLRTKGEYIELRKSNIPFKVIDKIVILVDDVVFAGRTVRAALDGLKDYGRALKVQLAVLVDRGHRQLPIHPDFTGKVIPTSIKENIRVELTETDGVERVVID